MPWWGWLALGASLLAAEIAVQTEFWLAVVGVAAFFVGGTLWITELAAPVWIQWLAFAGLAIAFNVFFRRQVHEKLVGHVPDRAPDLIGDEGAALEAIAPGAEGQVSLRGSNWRARNVGAAPLAEGATVRITGRDGILLEVDSEGA